MRPRFAASSALLACLALTSAPAVAATAPSVAWFQRTEHSLMDAIAKGDHAPWQRVLDPGFRITDEEGNVLGGAALLDFMRGLPPGLAGTIAVRELTVDDRGAFAVVRFLADET